MKIGSIVMFTNGAVTVRRRNHMLHSVSSEYYPPAKTIGTVMGFLSRSELVRDQWPSGTTSGDDSWWCHPEFLLEL